MSHSICAASLVPICHECLHPIQWQVDPLCDAISTVSLLSFRLWKNFQNYVLMQSFFLFFISLYTLGKKNLQTAVYRDHQKEKYTSVSLPFISIPNYIDYISSNPVQIAQYFEGPAFYLGFMNYRADPLLLCISFHVKEYFMFSLIYTSSEASACSICLALALFVLPRNSASC